jgi:hypothetical protein
MSDRPSGFLSVMADRAPSVDGLDYFPTPPWAGRAGAELIKRLDPDASTCWEPACGGGHMVHGLRDYFEAVLATDVHEYTPGQALLDFLGAAVADDDTPIADWIVTNPPFVLGEAFVRQAWKRARRGVAMLLRLSFLEGAARYRLLYQDCPLTLCAPFAERVPMVKGHWDPAASSATAYAWFVFDKRDWIAGGALPSPRLWPIPPGTKARLTKPDDAARFGVAAETPLLEGA